MHGRTCLYTYCLCVLHYHGMHFYYGTEYIAHAPPLPSEINEYKTLHASFNLHLQCECPVLLGAVPPYCVLISWLFGLVRVSHFSLIGSIPVFLPMMGVRAHVGAGGRVCIWCVVIGGWGWAACAQTPTPRSEALWWPYNLIKPRPQFRCSHFSLEATSVDPLPD